MARLDRKRILLLVVGLIFLIGGISLLWLDPERDGFTFRLTPWSIFFLGVVVFTYITTRKSKANTKGGDNDKADQT